MMRENSSASESSSGRGRSSRPASFPNVNMMNLNPGIPSGHHLGQNQKIREMTKNLKNMNFRDKNSRSKRFSLTDSEASDTTSHG